MHNCLICGRDRECEIPATHAASMWRASRDMSDTLISPEFARYLDTLGSPA